MYSADPRKRLVYQTVNSRKPNYSWYIVLMVLWWGGVFYGFSQYWNQPDPKAQYFPRYLQLTRRYNAVYDKIHAGLQPGQSLDILNNLIVPDPENGLGYILNPAFSEQKSWTPRGFHVYMAAMHKLGRASELSFLMPQLMIPDEDNQGEHISPILKHLNKVDRSTVRVSPMNAQRDFDLAHFHYTHLQSNIVSELKRALESADVEPKTLVGLAEMLAHVEPVGQPEPSAPVKPKAIMP